MSDLNGDGRPRREGRPAGDLRPHRRHEPRRVDGSRRNGGSTGYGKLDVLVNNAGIAGAAPIDQYSLADWEKIVAVNLTVAFNGIQAVVPAMKKAGGGSIVDISSIQG
jgi:NAD(P)-dependent dehydrogenase (short-subunit alcohol dehydrogenase family)